MAKDAKLIPSKGSETPRDIYLLVGVSLSWWEASEDMLMGLFRILCGFSEPTAFEAFVSSPRNRRGEMIKAAMKRYKGRFTGNEIEQVLAAMKALDKLAATRNEIAHGHCSQPTVTHNGDVVMSGNYLLPSLNEQGWHERSFRYAHTVESMSAFVAEVRQHRGVIMDVQFAVQIRKQEEGLKKAQTTRD
jgi:hypothetical protein